MKFILIAVFFCLCFTEVSAQLEISSGYAVDKNLADGVPLLLGYDIKINKRLYTKPQIGYKYLYYYNDYVGATLKVSIFEIHQTLSYEIIKKRKYILKPNIGINYRFYKWKGEMVPPLNSTPIRAWVTGVRDGYFVLASTDGASYNEYHVNNMGFSFQLQNQFKLNKKLWLHVTPFIEPDYDRSQNTGGCYLGVVFKNF